MSSNMTVQLFALEMQISVDRLIQQFLDIGIIKTKLDYVTPMEQEVLFKSINRNNILSTHKLSLRRQTRSTVNVLGCGGKNKQVQVEFRKKKVYVVPCMELESNTVLSHNLELKNSNKVESNIDDKPMHHVIIDNKFTSSESTETNISNIQNDILQKDRTIKNDVLQKNSAIENDQHEPDLVDVDRQLHLKIPFKIYNKSQKLINKKQQSNKIKNIDSHGNIKLFRSCFNKNNQNDSDKIDRVSTLKINNDNNHHYQQNSEKRYYTTKIRSKLKITGKPFKQKKNDMHCSYTMLTNHEPEKEEALYVHQRIHKNKRKNSTLIQSFKKPTQTIVRNIIIGEKTSVLELSNKMSVKSSYMIKFMMQLGLMVTINQVLDQETAQLIIEEMGHVAVLRKENELEELIMHDNYKRINNASIHMKNNLVHIYKNRSPVVAIMGHVDHGKTSLLDYIRSTKIAASELGGITQSIGAYRVTVKNSGSITFLDTPGHVAFTNMRARGVRLTDIVVLLIAADDGVMPQTVESIQHIKSTNIPVVVAINKIDKIDINIDRIKNELNSYGLVPEEWGGSTQFIKISAISGVGVNDLLDAILLQAEMLELKTTYHGLAKGIVIESSLDQGRGPIIVVLIREGELKCGDIILCGTEYGRVRAMRDEYGSDVNIAYPSMPVEILGLSGVPNAGEMMVVLQHEKKAKEVALYRQMKRREIKLARKQESFPNNVFSKMDNTVKTMELNFIIKSDTQGSMEAICTALVALSTDRLIIKIVFASIGNITETDAVLACTSNAVILGFNVKSDSSARHVIESDNVDVRYYSVIYDLLDEAQKMIQNSIVINSASPIIIGTAEVHNIFHSPNRGIIAGCIVTDGVIKIKKRMIIFRNNVVVHKGELESLRRFKNDVNEVKSGMECGIRIKNYHDIRFGDIIKVFDNMETFV